MNGGHGADARCGDGQRHPGRIDPEACSELQTQALLSVCVKSFDAAGYREDATHTEDFRGARRQRWW